MPIPAKGVKNLPANTRDRRVTGFYPWVGKMPWRSVWQPIPVFLPGESHGQSRLVGHGVAKSWTCLKQLTTHAHCFK